MELFAMAIGATDKSITLFVRTWPEMMDLIQIHKDDFYQVFRLDASDINDAGRWHLMH